MRRIIKHCKPIAAAEKIQEKLYSKYDYVKLIEFPRFEDFGIYIWEVK